MKCKIYLYVKLILVVGFIGLIICCEKEDGPVQSKDEIIFKKTIGSWLNKQEKIAFFADSTFVDTIFPYDTTKRNDYYVFKGKYCINNDTMKWGEIDFIYTWWERLLNPFRFFYSVIPEYKVRINGDTLVLAAIRKFNSNQAVTSNDFVIDGTWYDICPVLVNVNERYANGTCKFSFTFKPNNTYSWEVEYITDTVYKDYSVEDRTYDYVYPYLNFTQGSKVLVNWNGNKMNWEYKEKKFLRQN